MDTDAIGNDIDLNVPYLIDKLNIENLCEIEDQLQIYEKVSLVYILFENCAEALDILLQLTQNDFKVLNNWANSQIIQKIRWQELLVEALTVIQNYEVLKKYGFTRSELNNRFLPHHPFTSLFIHRKKKALFYICEQLNKKETACLLNSVKEDFKKKNLEYRLFDEQYLEMYLCYWDQIGYISYRNGFVGNILHIAKIKEFDKIYDILSSVNNENSNRLDNINVTVSNKLTLNNESNQDKSCDNSNRYFINTEKPGVCLIINQQNFFKEVESDLQHLCASYKLEERVGSYHDKEQLAFVFRKLGFKVIVKENLEHQMVIKEIDVVIKSIKDESSVIICIMSHGEKGVIYGCNSCKIEVNYIIDVICKNNTTNLMGKPKVLLLQSCQGNECQEIPENENELTTDGGSSNETVPSTPDMLMFWSTIPGFAAIRNKNSGSWFIQTLTKKILQQCNTNHFEDICTSVINDVTNMKWQKHNKKQFSMLPFKTSTLRKQFFLPKI